MPGIPAFEDRMRALRFEKTGSLDGLVIRDVPKPTIGPGAVLVQVKAAAINPSDIKNVLGAMHETTLPRTPGRDFSGVVMSGPGALVGKSVFGSGGNLGIGRDGSHAEFMAVPKTVVLAMPEGFTFDQSAAIGVAYMTAWAALIKAAQLQSGENVLILGITGSVGSAAARIAHKQRARVLGTVRKATDIVNTRRLPVDVWINLETTELSNGTREVTEGRGANVIFDLVGGPMFEKCLAALAWRGRQVAISSSPEPRVGFNLVDFYHNESRLLGVDSLKLSFQEAAEILRELTPGFESGDFPPPDVRAFPLNQGPKVYRDMHEGRIKGTIVLNP
jgi:NADPH:quinone reductase